MRNNNPVAASKKENKQMNIKANNNIKISSSNV